MTRFVCFGEIMIRLTAPEREVLLQSPRLNTNIAGAEANVAVSLARFGHEVRMATLLPDNALGRAARDELRRHGVDTGCVVLAPGRMGLFFVTLGAGARPTDVIYDRAHSVFAEAAAPLPWAAALADADWLHVSGVTPAVSAKAASAAIGAVKAARAAGVKVSFDANFRAKLWEARGEDPRPVLNALFAEADLAFAEARDIALITGERVDDNSEAARVAFSRYPNLQRIAATERTVIAAEHHELGAWMQTRSDETRSKPRKLEGIVDRIGGGDAFAAGLLHGIARGATDRDMLDFALAAACLKHTIPGDFNLVGEADVRFALSHEGADVRR